VEVEVMVFASASNRVLSRIEQPDSFSSSGSLVGNGIRMSVMHASYTPRPLATVERKNIDSIWNQHYKRFGADALTKPCS
jgi:hypothetical protein